MKSPKTLEEFAELHGKPLDVVKRELFWVVDLLMEMEITEEVEDCGLYFNHRHNSPKNMLQSHNALLWAKYEHLCGERPDPAGPSIDFVYTVNTSY